MTARRPRSRTSRPLGAAVGLVLADLLPPVPDEVHPVARFGAAMSAIERALWRDQRRAGVAYATAGTVLGAAGGQALGSTASAVAVAAAGGQLRRTALGVADLLDAGDLDGARRALRSLAGRDASVLDASGVAAAVVESVAENTVDAVYAPALWAAALGPAGAGVHRALNTMDAMVGHRSERHERFGWAAARADDAAAWVPARAFAVAVWMLAPPDRRSDVLRAVRQDAPAHPSPNAGVAEAAVAAALGVELGGPLRYGDREDRRPSLGSGPRPVTADIARACQLTARAQWLLAATLAAVGTLRRGRRR